jgi:hypothetical protein
VGVESPETAPVPSIDGPYFEKDKNEREREKTTSIVDVGTLYPLTKIRLDTELVFSSA